MPPSLAQSSIDGQKVYLTISMSFLLRNEYRPEESGVDMSTPVHPVAPPLNHVRKMHFFNTNVTISQHPFGSHELDMTVDEAFHIFHLIYLYRSKVIN